MALFTGVLHLGAGMSVGLSGLAAGFAIGIVGDAGVRGTAQQSRVFVGMVSPNKKMWLFSLKSFADISPHLNSGSYFDFR